MDSLRELFKQKEKELAHVVDRVDILSKNLDSVVQKKVCSQENGASKNQTELGRLCAEVTVCFKSISIKRIVICLCLSVCLNAFAQFSRYRAEILQVGRGRPGTGRGGVKNCGGAPGGGLGCCKGPGNDGQPS